MIDRRPSYMGSVPKDTHDTAIDGIDVLIQETALRMGMHVVDTLDRTYYGTNIARQYQAQPIVIPRQVDATEGHPTLLGV